MWYLAWILGAAFAGSFAVFNALWVELENNGEGDNFQFVMIQCIYNKPVLASSEDGWAPCAHEIWQYDIKQEAT